MSQDQRNRPHEESSTGRSGNDFDRKRAEGFEGMNYEQRRQPYQPRQAAKSNGHRDNRAASKNES